VPVGVGPPLATSPDLVVDALLGYSPYGSPHGLAAELVAALPNTPIIALDAPSGLEQALAGLLPTPHALTAPRGRGMSFRRRGEG
jgi:NAD(P)H-hydrate repair Nnr-like enzyme with NAD(P)H-hydrate epimerase domain